MTWLLVGIGGAAGSILRYGAGRLAIHFLGPGTILGTFIVNVTGSFALGFFLTFALERSAIPAEVRGMVAIGLLGGYTTFSTFSYDSIRLLESGEVMRAGLNILGHLVISLAAAYAGVLSGRAV
jgi:CrcB protein